MQIEIKEKKKNLGIYYTPEPVVRLMFEILNIWKKADEEDHGWSAQKRFPSLIDPACGEGGFLKEAIQSGFTKPSYVWGIDIDPSALEKWKEINLFQLFNSKARPELHFFNQNGLMPLNGNLKFRHKPGGLKHFDAVVGNPPYGGVGIGNIDKDLEKALLDYDIWDKAKQKNGNGGQDELLLTGTRRVLSESLREKMKRFPIEVLFIDRFIQLARDGGWIAVVLPDGILANFNFGYVRDYISDKTKIEAIISLPRDTFKNAGTSAKTSILFLKKIAKVKPDYPIFLAALENLERDNITTLMGLYGKFYETKQTVA